VVRPAAATDLFILMRRPVALFISFFLSFYYVRTASSLLVKFVGSFETSVFVPNTAVKFSLLIHLAQVAAQVKFVFRRRRLRREYLSYAE
jgi:hypothetical protein